MPETVEERARRARELVKQLQRTDPGFGANRGNGAHDGDDDDDARPIIDASDQDLERTSAKAWAAVKQANVPERLFLQGNTPVRIEGDGHDDGSRLQPLTEDRMRYEVARSARWVKSTNRSILDAAPPISVVRDMLADPNIPLPPIERIVSAPVFGPNGELQTEPGYHAASRTFYAPDPGFELPPVPERPTDEEVATATGLIDELLCDFPFVARADRAHAYAETLQPYVRSMIQGQTPILVHESPTPGSGKDLLAEVTMWSSLGRLPSSLIYSANNEEMRKRLTATLLTQPEAVLIPNVGKTVDSGDLCDAVTRSVWQDRFLGVSAMVSVRVRCVWMLTANNPGMSKEVARRSVRIRLDAGVERPWDRPPDSFRHPNLPLWVRQNRARLVWASLTVIRHWIAQGAPAGTASMGSFESWASVMKGILDAIHVPGFLENRADFYDAADTETGAWTQLVGAWWAAHGADKVSASTLFPLTEDIVGFDFGKGSDRSQKTAFGMQLAQQRDRIYGEWQVLSAGEYRRAHQWRLNQVVVAHHNLIAEESSETCEHRERVHTEKPHNHAENGGACEPCKPSSAYTRNNTFLYRAGEGSQGSRGSHGSTLPAGCFKPDDCRRFGVCPYFGRDGRCPGEGGAP